MLPTSNIDVRRLIGRPFAACLLVPIQSPKPTIDTFCLSVFSLYLRNWQLTKLANSTLLRGKTPAKLGAERAINPCFARVSTPDWASVLSGTAIRPFEVCLGEKQCETDFTRSGSDARVLPDELVIRLPWSSTNVLSVYTLLHIPLFFTREDEKNKKYQPYIEGSVARRSSFNSTARSSLTKTIFFTQAH